ncbi:hypothetical protein Pcinc_003498 [Petrolisthes cinctipes]|uniref:Uncharacterized protein n=1 Tax=Petrolisthes cinctipes TaxID=88211 RepID=A0AAE1GIX1_PETCI|nr:hypothetical protein Pcinc_003498 [Petrolisthes cinctipes]
MEKTLKILLSVSRILGSGGSVIQVRTLSPASTRVKIALVSTLLNTTTTSEARSEQFQKKQQGSSSSTKEQDEEWTLEVDHPKNYLCVERRMLIKCSETDRAFANVKNID